MWFQIEYLGKNTYRVHLSVWHPGFWMHVFRMIRSQGTGPLEASLLMLVLAWQLVRRKS